MRIVTTLARSTPAPTPAAAVAAAACSAEAPLEVVIADRGAQAEFDKTPPNLAKHRVL